MKKIYLFATALAALVSCSSDEFVGDQSPQETNVGEPISFEMSTPKVTRAEGDAAALALDYKFKVYGVKKNGSDYSNVFATGGYSTDASYDADPNAYWVWYTASTAETTTSNTKDWEYVGAAGAHGTSGHEATVASGKDQTIKYWDYSADQYEFVAYSATVGSPSITKYTKDGFTVTATAEQLAGLYVADKLTITEKDDNPAKPASIYNKIGDIVRLTFCASAAKVRLGIYETIPGYQVKNVSFRPNGTITGFTDASTTHAILSGSFNGSSSSGSAATFNVTYNPHAIFTQEGTSAQSGYFDFGTFASGSTAMGETSTSPTWATGSADYQNVFPNTDHVGNMILYVDYDLYNSVSNEIIHVTGAKAVVPSMYMTWNPNYAYTYLFKISDNTNGTTGIEGTDPEGLFPITFDALTVATTDGQEVGTITTVSTPAITTYQKGSVSSAGITYATASTTEPIYITVNTTGTLASLTAENMKLYTVAAGTTEADLILTNKIKTASALLSILNANEEKQGITFTSGKAAKFTPAAGTTYAVQYIVGSVNYYKIIVVGS